MKRRDENAAYWVMLREAERKIIHWGIEQGGSVRQAAILLGVNVGHLYKRCRALGIDYNNKIIDTTPCEAPSSAPFPLSEVAESD